MNSPWFPKQTVGLLPQQAALRWPQRRALTFCGQHWNFAQLDAMVDQVARGLLALGVEPGDKVAVLMSNRPEWIWSMYAIAKVGATIVPLNTRYKTDDLAYTLAQSDASVLISLDRSGPVDYFSLLSALMPELADSEPQCLQLKKFPRLKQLVLLSATDTAAAGCISWSQLLASGQQIAEETLQRAGQVDPDGLLIIAYTSGTTGNPKGVMHSHAAIRNVTDTINRMGTTEEDVILNYLPMFHLYAYSMCSMVSLLSGARQVLMTLFEPEQVCQLIEREGITIVHGFDTHYRDIMQAQEQLHCDLSSLKIGTFPAGSDASLAVAERTQQQLCNTLSCWGMTEVWSCASLSFPVSSPEQRIAASGYPNVGYHFKIVDSETGEPCGPGQEGEILVSGYMLTRGYYNKPDATAAAIRDGWLYTGDAGLIRSDGHLQYIGRYKDMLKVGGENVSPAEVEWLLLKHKAVAQVAVVAGPDPRLQEVAVAFVVNEGAAVVTEAELIAHCRDKVASYKIPRRVFFVDALPETPTGKVQKHILRDQARALMSA